MIFCIHVKQGKVREVNSTIHNSTFIQENLFTNEGHTQNNKHFTHKVTTYLHLYIDKVHAYQNKVFSHNIHIYTFVVNQLPMLTKMSIILRYIYIWISQFNAVIEKVPTEKVIYFQ